MRGATRAMLEVHRSHGYEAATHGDMVNNYFYSWEHRHIYDFESLATLLRSAGFEDVREASFGESAHELLRGIDRHDPDELGARCSASTPSSPPECGATTAFGGAVEADARSARGRASGTRARAASARAEEVRRSASAPPRTGAGPTTSPPRGRLARPARASIRRGHVAGVGAAAAPCSVSKT